ncbi:meiosis-specific topoisomerase Spo11 [Pleomassaria siparia CBS 279.74]|uniref:DNA topoisomerase (ATP-hydrolyzing) n=1 Tax=Pleomassaria siparia CBS 279.74 TaxID=1314801 RepID=A0A6G1JS56_9PLEO|nr:meiosis-specific topoisomerase Spo11 [Pleomassaria siparia CBS 279.74]
MEAVNNHLYHPNQMEDPTRSSKDRDWVIARIEGMFERIVDSLIDGNGQLAITLKTRAGISRRKPHTRNVESLPPAKIREINFPGSNEQEAWRFTVLVRILELVHGCLIDNTMMTKRDLYYRHPDLFGKQAVVDRYVDDLACTLGVSRCSLNVGMLVPKLHMNDTVDLSFIRWILVIEKEATFRSFLSSSQWGTWCIQGLALTAKGYPDLASRKFLGRLADDSPDIPMFALVDFDPDGIAIMSTYKHGSYRLAHEDVRPEGTGALCLPQLRWLGVQSHQMSRTPVTEGDTDKDAISEAQGIMRLTTRDRMKARHMLDWDLCAEDGPEQDWRRELQTMLMLNIKAEMQILDELPGGLASWLGTELGGVSGGQTAMACELSDDDMLF